MQEEVSAVASMHERRHASAEPACPGVAQHTCPVAPEIRRGGAKPDGELITETGRRSLGDGPVYCVDQGAVAQDLPVCGGRFRDPEHEFCA